MNYRTKTQKLKFDHDDIDPDDIDKSKSSTHAPFAVRLVPYATILRIFPSLKFSIDFSIIIPVFKNARTMLIKNNAPTDLYYVLLRGLKLFHLINPSFIAMIPAIT